MGLDRRSVISALGLFLPFGLRASAGAPEAGRPDVLAVLRYRPFADAVREAFGAERGLAVGDSRFPCRRVEVGPLEGLPTAVQGCHNDRPFAGFPAGHLRIVRAGSEPGRVWRGVRLYVSTVDVAWVGGQDFGAPSRPLDFATLPPAPALADSPAFWPATPC